MSRAIFDAPMIAPPAVRTGETVSEMFTSEPSFRWRTVSKCSTDSPARTRDNTSVSSPRRSSGINDQ